LQKVDPHGLLDALLSITQILEHIYSIVDAYLYTIHEEMLTLVELHRIQKNCSVKNNEIKSLINLSFLLEVSLFILTK